MGSWSSLTRSATASSWSPSTSPFDSPRKIAGARAQPVSRTATPRPKLVRSVSVTATPRTPKERNSNSSWTTVTTKKGSQRLTNQERIAASTSRTRLCADFLLGKCKKGHKCTLLHDISFMVPDEQKVFIGGIPRSCTSRMLIAAVNAAGFKVLNVPKCNPSGFAPKVCMESVEKAKAFLKVARIEVGSNIADVRRFKDSRAVNPDNFCVIIEDVPESMTGMEVMEGLEEQGFLIERSPLVKPGSSTIERCEMTTVENADALSEIGKITIKGQTMPVKPFFNLNDGRNLQPASKAGTVEPNTPNSRSNNRSRGASVLSSAGVSLAARGATTPRSLVSVLSVPPTPERSLRRNRNKSVRANTWSQQRSKQDAIHSFMNRAVGSKRGSTRSLGLGIKTAAAVPDSPTVPVTRTDL